MAITELRWRLPWQRSGAEGPTTIRDADCAGVSYPTFYDDLARVAEA